MKKSEINELFDDPFATLNCKELNKLKEKEYNQVAHAPTRNVPLNLAEKRVIILKMNYFMSYKA